jgi:hypothetical protein
MGMPGGNHEGGVNEDGEKRVVFLGEPGFFQWQDGATGHDFGL